jgi:hypothetical protein
VAPPTINLDDPDDEARVDIATKPRELAPHGRAPVRESTRWCTAFEASTGDLRSRATFMAGKESKG